MKTRSEFVDHLSEVFREFGVIESRRMFGGYGIYYEGLIFGLVIGETLYLKTDEVSVSLFHKAGSVPFEYEKDGQMMKISYYSIPVKAFDNPDIAKEWASVAFAASLRAQSRKVKKRKEA